jgi:hypothetical protein
MSFFDYNAPAELFLAKPAKGCRTKYRRFATAAEALRYAVEELRTPKTFGARLKFNACTRPMVIRCASLSDRASERKFATRPKGPPLPAVF